MTIKRKLSKPITWLLTIAILFSTMPITTLAEEGRLAPYTNESSGNTHINFSDDTLLLPNDYDKSINLSSTKFEPRCFSDALLNKDNEEVAYVESIAEALIEPIGIVGHDDIDPEQEMHVFVWLQELPNSLERIYRAKRMNVQGYTESRSNARTAREHIRNRGSGSTKASQYISIYFEYFEVFSGFAIKAPKSTVEQLAEIPGVYMITEVEHYELSYTPNPTYTPGPTYIPDPSYTTPGNAEARRIWRIGDIHAEGIDGGKTQKKGEPVRPVRIGVIDSGLQADHPDIKGAYMGGWNFTNCSVTGNSENMTLPYGDHGMHVAGTIASQGIESLLGNESSLGIAPGVDLYMAQVFGEADTTTNSGSGDIVIAAVEAFVAGERYQYTQRGHIYQPGLPSVDIINMSISVPMTSPNQEASRNTAYEAGQYARNNAVVAGVVVVASAGNDADYQSFSHQGERNPYTITTGGASLQISVAASMYGGIADNPKEPAYFSSIGPVRETAEIKPDVIAPGDVILSTSLDNGYSNKSGTSMAAANVTGVVALMLQRYPDATPAEIKARMMNTADPFLMHPNRVNNKVYRTNPHFFNPKGDQISVYEQGAGFIDPYRAIMEDSNIFITVENTVPTNHPDKSTQMASMASFSFGDACRGSETKRLTATVHGASGFAIDVIYRNNTRYSASSEGAVKVNIEHTEDNTFDVWLTISEDASKDSKTGNLYEGYIEVKANGKIYHLPWAVRVGFAEPTFSIMAFASRPIVSTATDPMVRSAGGEHPLNSNAASLYQTWNGTMPVHPRFGVPAYDLCLYAQDEYTGIWEPAYYLGTYSVSNPINDGTRLHRVTNGIGSQGTHYYTRERTTIKNGAYLIVIEAGPNFEPHGFMDIGIVFTDGTGDMSVQLTIDGVDDDGFLPVDSDENISTAKITGRIFSPALDIAVQYGFLWTDIYDFWQNKISVFINQSFNVLAFSSKNDVYGTFPDSFNLTGVIPNGDNVFYCDPDGYFEFILDVTQADKNGGYLFSYVDNHSVVGLEGFYFNDNGASRPLIGANKSTSITPQYKLKETQLRIDARVVETVARGNVYNFGLILNEGASGENIVWSVSDPSFALIDDTGNIYILNKTGTVRLIATDPVNGLSNSITLRIAS